MLQKHCSQGARILAVIPTHSYSHQQNYRPILVELANRGHEVVVVTTHPLNDPTIKNYKEISVENLMPPLRALDFVTLRWQKTWLGLSDELWSHTSYLAADKILGYEPVRKLYEPKTRKKFDLLITEYIWYHAVFGLAYVLDCPSIGKL